MLIQKTKSYLTGICSITSQVGKEKKLSFDNNEIIEVTEEQIEKINKSWYVEIPTKKEVKNGK
jgi:hypothetical protein